ERPLRTERGQQIRCDSEADGYSPDGRERDAFDGTAPRVVTQGPYALILVSNARGATMNQSQSQPVTDVDSARRVAFVQACWHKATVGPRRPTAPRRDRQIRLWRGRHRLLRSPRLLRDPAARAAPGQ